jgi:hypothetical protein
MCLASAAFEQETVFRGHTRKDRRTARVAAEDAEVAALLAGGPGPDAAGDGTTATAETAAAAAAEDVDNAAIVAKVAAAEPLKGPDLIGDEQLFGVYIELVTELLKAGERDLAEELLSRAQDLANMRAALAKAKLVGPLGAHAGTTSGVASDREDYLGGGRGGKAGMGKARLAAIKAALGFCNTVAVHAAGEVDKVWKKLKPLCTR